MFAYILKSDPVDDAVSDEFFKRFKSTPGLLHAYDMRGADDPNDQIVVTVWEDRKAADEYLSKSALRKEVDQTVSGVTRTMYDVRDHK